jgi:hypothetical protein
MASRPEGSIAVNPEVARFVNTRRTIVDLGNTDFTDVSAVVLAARDLNNGVVSRLRATGFDLPLFVVADSEESVNLDLHGVTGVLASDDQNATFFGDMVETAATKYDDEALPPFFGALARYERRGYSAFDCPGHQGGQFFMRHPAGRRFVDFFGHNLLARLTAHYERHVDHPVDLDEGVVTRLAPRTAGFRVPIDRFISKVKMSQDEDPNTQAQVLAALRRPGPYANPALAKQMHSTPEAQSRPR